MAMRSPNFANNCSTGFANSSATCRGVAPGIPIASGFRKSCSSKLASPPEEVLRLWSGLGYYSRARNLQKAAQQIIAKHAGQFPTRMDEALALPGVGNYTAAAILSIAFGEKHAVLD